MTGSGTQGTGSIPISSAGAQVTRQGARGSAGNSTSAGATGAGTSLQGAGVGPARGPSSSRDTGRFEERQENVVVPQKATLGRSRPKWF